MLQLGEAALRRLMRVAPARLLHVVHNGLHVFVATSGQVDHHQMILGQVGRCSSEYFGQGVSGFRLE